MIRKKRKVYTARAQREGKWWAISIEGLPGALSQVRRLDQAEAVAREVIALVLDVPDDSFDVVVAPELGEEYRDAIAELNRAKDQYAESMAALAERQEKVTLLLVRDGGLTVRDAATVLGVSFQRVSQLTSRSKRQISKAPVRRGRIAS
jgi:DNA-directed RNA polymerase specialized sigma24 family protein